MPVDKPFSLLNEDLILLENTTELVFRLLDSHHKDLEINISNLRKGISTDEDANHIIQLEDLREDSPYLQRNIYFGLFLMLFSFIEGYLFKIYTDLGPYNKDTSYYIKDYIKRINDNNLVNNKYSSKWKDTQLDLTKIYQPVRNCIVHRNGRIIKKVDHEVQKKITSRYLNNNSNNSGIDRILIPKRLIEDMLFEARWILSLVR